MKRNLLYTLALATFLVACDDDNYKDWADPQHNDPETAQNVIFSAAPVAAINLADVTGDSVAIFTPSIQTEEGATVTYQVTLDEEETLEADNLCHSRSTGQGCCQFIWQTSNRTYNGWCH